MAHDTTFHAGNHHHECEVKYMNCCMKWEYTQGKNLQPVRAKSSVSVSNETLTKGPYPGQ